LKVCLSNFNLQRYTVEPAPAAAAEEEEEVTDAPAPAADSEEGGGGEGGEGDAAAAPAASGPPGSSSASALRVGRDSEAGSEGGAGGVTFDAASVVGLCGFRV
jgi:hypothetical protein